MRVSTCLVALLLTACGGGPAFDGTFRGSFQGQSVTLEWKHDGKQLAGTIRWAGLRGEVTAARDGDHVTGKVTAPGYDSDFEATLKGDHLEWVYTRVMGFEQRIPIQLERAVARKSEASGASIDPALVGNWYTEVGGTGMSGNTLTTRIRCALRADGSFEYGGGESVFTLREGSGDPIASGASGPAGMTRGQWRCEGQVLSWRAAGGSWVPTGRYALSGNDLMIYGPDGSKTLWSRE